MNRTAATTLYISKSKVASEMIRRIMLWNPKDTGRGNARAMGLNAANGSQQIINMKKKYGLKCKFG